MKTMIEFLDGTVEELDNSAPSIDVDELQVCLIDKDCTCLTDAVSLNIIKRIVFEPIDRDDTSSYLPVTCRSCGWEAVVVTAGTKTKVCENCGKVYE